MIDATFDRPDFLQTNNLCPLGPQRCDDCGEALLIVAKAMAEVPCCDSHDHRAIVEESRNFAACSG